MVSNLCDCPVSYIGEVNTDETIGKPIFRILHAVASEQDQAEIFIIENKTENYSEVDTQTVFQQNTFFPNLFDQISHYYIVNKIPPVIIKANYVDYDFLVLICKDIECAADEVLSHFKKPSRFESVDISSLLQSTSSNNRGGKNAEFFQRLFYASEMQVAEFLENKEKKIIGDVTAIPEVNKISKLREVPRRANPEYITLLTKDQSFEV